MAAWCEENLASHSSAHAAVLLGLEVLGFRLTWHEDRFGQKVIVTLGNKDSQIRLETWDDELNNLLGGRMGTVVLKPDAEEDVEYFYVKSRRKVKTFDQDGNPKVSTPIFAVVKADKPPHGWYGNWIRDTPEQREIRTVDGLEVVGVLARLVNGTNEGSRYGGRGTSFRGALRSIRGSGEED